MQLKRRKAVNLTIMANEKYKNLKAHTRYHDKSGKRLPGTTTILGVMSKGYGLMKWYWQMGMKGIDVEKYVDKTANIGTLGHYLIECELKDEQPDLEPFSNEEINAAENCLIKFYDWQEENELEVLGVEKILVSEKHKYGGTIDLYCKLNGKYTLVDLKTSKAIYDSHMIQLAAYKNLLEENDYKVEQVKILRIGRTDDEGFEVRTQEDLSTEWELFQNLINVYNLKKQL